jgi:tRNA dimethylallyltransferase
LDAEIISADSMQVYRHMDIGTAKPSPEELSAVPHHMIDIVEPAEAFSAGRYRDMVVGIIEDLRRRGKASLIVGGTGLYMKALTRGLFAGPAADWGLRERLLEEERNSPGVLYRRLQENDPAAAAAVEPGDARRIIRALEVGIATGEGISTMRKLGTEPLPYPFRKIGLRRGRAELYGLINQRVDQMIERGLVKEVERLLTLHPGITALQAIGYKEIVAHLAGDCSLAEAVALIKQRTRNYAKRQFTWFRSEPDVRWVDMSGGPQPDEIAKAIAILLEID